MRKSSARKEDFIATRPYFDYETDKNFQRPKKGVFFT